MAKKTKIELEIDAKGGQKLKKATQQSEKHAKALERQGRASKAATKADQARYTAEKQGVIQTAPAAKNFSKMSRTIDGGTGAGGLVRAYALLAANVFALTAAFGVLSRAAQTDTLMESMKVLELQTGKSVTIIGRELQKVSGFGMDLAESMRATSLALSAGFDSSSIKQLGEVARNAAVSLGRPMGDALDRIFRGVIKVEPELLDEIGLFVRVKDASAKYASELGVAASSLTEFEKRQAFAAEAIRQGQEKFEAFSAVDTDPYSQLAAVFSDLAQDILSFVNVPLKALISVLTSSKTVLVAVFGAIAVVLLKKAIPALGVFALDAKKSAADAVAANMRYREDLNLGVSAQRIAKEKEIKIIEDAVKKERDLLMKRRRAQTGDFPGQTGKGGKALQAANEKLNKANLRGKKKIEALEGKILALNKSKRAVNKAEIKEVQKALKAEIAAEKRLLELAKDRRKVKKDFPDITAKKGTAAAREELKLATREATTGGIATAVSTAEFSGYSAGIKALKAEAATLGKQGKDSAIKFGFLNKQLFMLKGRAQIATLALGNFLSGISIWIQLFVILIPLFKKILNFFGLWTKEHLAYQEAASKTNKLLETFSDKINHNQKAIREAGPGTKKLMQAQTALNNTFSETGTAIAEQLDAFVKLQQEGNTFALWFESFKRRILGQASPEQISRDFIRSIVGDPTNFATQGKAFMDLVDGVIGAEGRQKLLDKNRLVAEKEARQLQDLAMGVGIFFGNQKNNPKGIVDLEKAGALGFDVPLIEKFLIGDDPDSAENKLGKILSRIKAETDRLLQESGNPFVTQLVDVFTENQEVFDRVSAAINTSARAANALDSVLEGASDTVRQYYDSFITKGDLDKPIDLFNQAIGKLTDPELNAPGRTEFLNAIEKGESQVRAILSESNRQAFDRTEDENERIQILKDQRQEFLKQQVLLLEQKELAAKLQSFQKLTANVAKKITGIEEQRLKAQGKTLGVQAEIAKFKTDEFLSTINMNRESFQTLKNKLEEQTTEEEKLAVLEQAGKTSKDIAQAQARFNAEERANLEDLIHQKTLEKKAELANLKVLQQRLNAEKSLIDARTKGARLDAQLARFASRGTTQLNPQQEAMLLINAERERLRIVERQTKMKKDILMAEMEILKATNRALESQGAFEGTELSADILNQQLDNSATILKETIDQNFENAAKDFGVKIRDQVNKGLNQSFSTGVKSFNDTDLGKQIIAMASPGLLSEALGLDQSRTDLVNLNRALKLTEQFAPQAKDQIKQLKDEIKRLDGVINEGSMEVFRQGINAMRSMVLDFANTMKETFGAQGVLVATISEVGVSILDMSIKMQDSPLFGDNDKLPDNAKKFGNALAQVANAFAGIRQIASASAAAAVDAIDKQIEAEKNRDGQSKASVEKLKAMEAKKDQIQRKAFETNKKMMMAEVVMNTALAMMKAIGMFGPAGIPFAAMFAAMGAAQLALIAGMQYGGGAGSVQDSGPSSLSLGKRDNRVDVSQRATAGELAFLRGDRGVGTNANNFQPMNAGSGLRKGYADGGVVVGERGPEMIQPTTGFNVIPNDQLGGRPVVANFTVNAIDAQGVEAVLQEQQGNIINMIRQAANDHGEEFIESVNTDYLGRTATTTSGGNTY